MVLSGVPMPVVIERDGNHEKHYDVYSRLLKDRVIFLGTPIDDIAANLIIGQLLFLEAEDSDKDIYLYINSPGGVVTAGLAIYDTMQYIRPQVTTICMGQAVSMGCFLLAAGTKGKRHALPHSRIMMHQVQGGQYGAAPDVAIGYEEMVRLNNMLMEILAGHTGRNSEDIKNHFDRDKWMSPEDAIQFGLIDSVLVKSTRVNNDD